MLQLTIHGYTTRAGLELAPDQTFDRLIELIKVNVPVEQRLCWLVSQKNRLLTLLDLDRPIDTSKQIDSPCYHSKTLPDLSYRYLTDIWPIPSRYYDLAKELYQIHVDLIRSHINGDNFNRINQLRRIEQYKWRQLRRQLTDNYFEPISDKKELKKVIKTNKKTIKDDIKGLKKDIKKEKDKEARNDLKESLTLAKTKLKSNKKIKLNLQSALDRVSHSNKKNKK